MKKLVMRLLGKKEMVQIMNNKTGEKNWISIESYRVMNTIGYSRKATKWI